MKVTIDHVGKDIHITVERDPLSPERFSAVCKLAGGVIAGAVLLITIYLVGFWAIPWIVGALAAVGLYKIIKNF